MGGVGWGWDVPTEYLVAPVLNWTGLSCDKNKIATEKPHNPSLKWTGEFVVGGGWGGVGGSE